MQQANTLQVAVKLNTTQKEYTMLMIALDAAAAPEGHYLRELNRQFVGLYNSDAGLSKEEMIACIDTNGTDKFLKFVLDFADIELRFEVESDDGSVINDDGVLFEFVHSGRHQFSVNDIESYLALINKFCEYLAEHTSPEFAQDARNYIRIITG